ncbi:MAG: HEAT repeat domain-containing protein [Phycisphaeraceae bacterium]
MVVFVAAAGLRPTFAQSDAEAEPASPGSAAAAQTEDAPAAEPAAESAESAETDAPSEPEAESEQADAAAEPAPAELPPDEAALAAAEAQARSERIAALFRQIITAQTPSELRQEAAAELLAMQTAEADQALVSCLSSQFGPPEWRPVLRALAEASLPPGEELVGPVLSVLRLADPAVQEQVVSALGQFRDDELVARLVEIARDGDQSAAVREGAVLALGQHRGQEVAGVLVDLTGVEQPERVQEAAFAALTRMTGLSHGADRAAWQDWWEHARTFSPDHWWDHLIENYARLEARRARQQQSIEKRLTELQRETYRNVPPEQRPALLLKMLEDSASPVRQLAMDLAVQRLVAGDRFDEPLRAAIRQLLTSPDADLRQRATLLLRDLADEPAADVVAHRLFRRAEPIVSVLRADLLMMARLPRAAAVEPALELLAHPSLLGEAAGALAAAAEADLLTDDQSLRAVRRTRRRLDETPPPPQVVSLLAKLGDEEDWQRIAGWLDSEVVPVKEAAAQAWASSHQPLTVLAERVKDPVVRSVLLLAAAERGYSSATFRALARARPEESAAREAWRRALESMALRVHPEVVLEAMDALEAQDVPVALRGRLLTAALERGEASQSRSLNPRLRADLLLSRAQLRRAMDEPERALADCEALAGLTGRLSPWQRRRLDRTHIWAQLALGQTDAAWTRAKALLNQKNDRRLDADDSPIDLLLAAAREGVASEDPAEAGQARQIVGHLAALPADMLAPSVREELEGLRAQAAKLARSQGVGERIDGDVAGAQPVASP